MYICRFVCIIQKQFLFPTYFVKQLMALYRYLLYINVCSIKCHTIINWIVAFYITPRLINLCWLMNRLAFVQQIKFTHIWCDHFTLFLESFVLFSIRIQKRAQNEAKKAVNVSENKENVWIFMIFALFIVNCTGKHTKSWNLRSIRLYSSIIKTSN